MCGDMKTIKSFLEKCSEHYLIVDNKSNVIEISPFIVEGFGGETPSNLDELIEALKYPEKDKSTFLSLGHERKLHTYFRNKVFSLEVTSPGVGHVIRFKSFFEENEDGRAELVLNEKFEVVDFNHSMTNLLDRDLKFEKNFVQISSNFQESGFYAEVELDLVFHEIGDVKGANFDWTFDGKNSKDLYTSGHAKKLKVNGDICYHCSFVDITILKNKYNNLEKAHRFFQECYEHFPGFLYVLDKKGKIIYANNSFCSHIGKTPQDIVNKSFDAITKDIVTDSGDKVEMVKNIVKFEQEIKDKEGNKNIYSVCEYPFFNQDGVVYCKGYFCVDISREKSLINELEQEKAYTLNQSKLASLGEVAAGMAHEINNPLFIISGSSKVLQKLMEEEIVENNRVNGLFGKIDNTVDRIGKIIKSMKNISRDTSNEEFDECLISDIYDDMEGLFSERAKNHSVDLKFVKGDDFDSLSINCKRIQLTQVLINLISNAMDAISELEEKWIKVEVNSNHSFLEFIITDSGNGIPDSLKEKIFTPFFTTKEVGKGTGIGLSLSHRIISEHDGSLSIDEKCENTKFIVKLPKSNTSIKSA